MELRSKTALAALATAAGLAAGLLTATPANAAASAHHFARCADLHRYYVHGVGRPGARDHVRGHTRPVTTFKVSRKLYNANRSLDRDKDGVACEQL